MTYEEYIAQGGDPNALNKQNTPSYDTSTTFDPYNPQVDTGDATPKDAGGAGPIPTNPDGSQVGGGTPWEAGSDHPSSSPPGYHWDENMAMFQPDAPSSGGGDTSTPPPAASTPPPAASTPPPSVAPPAQPSGGPTPPPAAAAAPPAEPAWQPPAVSAPSAPPAASPVPPSMAVSQPDKGQDAFGASIRAALLKALGQPEPTADDPSIAPAIAANRAASQRQLAMQRDAIAERLNAQGLGGSGALDAQMAQAFENSATQQGQFAGNAVLDQAKSRRQELVNLMQTGAGILNADDAQAIQAKIADLDAYLRQQSITNQDQQANDQMGLTGAYYQALLKQQQIRDLLGV